MDPLYRPHGVESRWQETWEAEGLYNAEASDPRPSFAIAHPPPNVTGELHLGPRAPAVARRHDRPHAADAGIQRALPARVRPCGHLDAERRREAPGQGGTDSPGSRTRGVRRARLGVAARVRRQDHVPVPRGSAPRSTTGASGSRWTRRTSAPSCASSSTSGTSGWIYRSNRIINWCPFHLTSLSDLELEHRETDDALTYVRYPFADGDGRRHDRDRARAGDDPRGRRRGRAPGRPALPRTRSAAR